MTTARAHTTRRPTIKPKLAATANARTALADWGPGLTTSILTFGQFSLFDAVMAVLDRTGPAHVDLATWTAGGADLEQTAAQMHDGRILSLRLVVDCSFPTRQPGYVSTMVRLFGADCIRTIRTHAKWCVIRNDEWAVVVRTSMNLNNNPRLEWLEVTDDPDLAAFLCSATDDIFAETPADQHNTVKPISDTQLAGLPAIRPASTIQMSRQPLRTGA